MELTKEIIDRLAGIMYENETSIRKFALSLGHSPSTLSEILSNRIKTLSRSIVLLLELKYGISRTWLETGHGKKELDLLHIQNPDELHLVRRYRNLNSTQKQLILEFTETLYYRQNCVQCEFKVAEKRTTYKPHK